MIDRELLTKSIEKFIPLLKTELNALINCLDVYNYSEVTTLTKIGDVERNVYWVTKGIFRQFFFIKQTEQIIYIAKEGQLITSLYSFIHQMPSEFAIENLTPATVCRIKKSDLDRLCNKYQGIQKLYNITLSHAYSCLENRIKSNLIYSPRERIKQFLDTEHQLASELSQKHLASYLNIRPETYSRLKAVLHKQRKKSTLPL